MEEKPTTFPRSDIEFVTARVADAAKGRQEEVKSSLAAAGSSLKQDTLLGAFARAGVPLETQEGITLVRQLGSEGSVSVDKLLQALAL